MMNTQIIRTALCMTGLALVSGAQAAELALPRDGWASWQVAAVEGAPDWCCWSSWNAGKAPQQACRLDDEHGNYGSRDHATTEAVRVYARVAGGKVERLRAFSASCAVEAATPIRDLGDVPVDDSAKWLASLLKSNTDAGKSEHFGDNLLAALAIHRGDLALNTLSSIARGDPRVEARKKAIFWFAILRGSAGAEVASGAMFGDPDADVRKHAAFATTQSKSPRVAADLIRLGNTDEDGDVRAQAWFWLAHSGAAESEDALMAALRKDSDEHVREQAIFALSQLPEERATRALIAAAEDKSLSNEQRKRAVFWLGQSESKAAQAYLERLLMGKVGH